MTSLAILMSKSLQRPLRLSFNQSGFYPRIYIFHLIIRSQI